jgi:predicted nucleic acid-binding protein
MLVDSDVLIDFLRGLPEARDFVLSLPREAAISAITVAELHVGVREGKERAALQGMLDSFRILPLDAEIARRGGLWRRDFGRSHGVGLNDALIAATAEFHALQLASLNLKHYPMLQGGQAFAPYLKH